ncbi:MAG TPA: acyltransferase domain-containing protein [Deltaproteobacteria bacterium]|nr:acyltransferase domain-containing protein [Deltaproteobacteria bacterium]
MSGPEAAGRDQGGAPHASIESGNAAGRHAPATVRPIAIVGIGCRYADARGPGEFWEIVRSERNTVRDVPRHRIDLGYDIDHFYDPRPRIPGKISSKKGGFLEHPELFDAAAFGIAPRDALTMEPQQRLMVEVAWDALEDAGIVPESIVGERVAVILGYMAEDYSRERAGVLGEAAVYRGHDVFTVGGMSHAVLSGRIAYLLGLTGPSFTLDTACSSSLIATHLACESLRRGESKMALAGGVNLFLSPEGNIALSRSGMLSMSGACKAFDASADGFVRAEGAGIVLLRPLSDALADGNPIYAVIRGSGISSDGRDGGHMMAPGRHGQAQAMRDAYAQAGFPPSEIQYVETHGTGTMIGDPVEVAALAEVMGPGRDPDRPLRIASVKGNLGHTESASGVAGLIKTALAIRHRVLPAQLHFETPNPAIPWDEIPIRVQTETTPWPGSGPVRAAVNSFGISGTNAHVILESPPPPSSAQRRRTSGSSARMRRDTEDRTRPFLLPISGHDPNALHELVEAHRDGLADPPAMVDLAYTLGRRKTHRSHRLCIVARSIEEFRRELDAHLDGNPTVAAPSARARTDTPPRIVMIFPGQGAQWLGMGRKLLRGEAAFSASIDRIDAAYRAHVDWSLRAVLEGRASIDWTKRLDVLQPVLVALEIALAELWATWGVRPDRVIGQSMGEIAAAFVAGVLRLEDVARLACHRGRIVARASGQGAMAVVALSREEASARLGTVANGVEIAGVNSPTTTILSGDREAVVSLVDVLEAEGVFARLLEVDFASHCFHMDPLLDDFREGIEGIRPVAARIPFDSTVDDEEKKGSDLGVDYWVRNLREPVAFDRGLTRSIDAEGEILIEVSPHPTLARASLEIARQMGRNVTHFGSLRRDEDERLALARSLAGLFVQGVPIDFGAVQPEGRLVPTPLYPYQRKRFWFGQRKRTDIFRQVHPLLGARSESSLDPRLHTWDFILDTDSGSFLEDHRLGGLTSAPDALHLELGLAAAQAMWPGRAISIRDVEMVRPLLLGAKKRRSVQLILRVDREGSGALRISSRTDERDAWTLHARCSLEAADPGSGWGAADRLDRAENETESAEAFFETLEDCGISLGPKCRTLRELESEPSGEKDTRRLVARMMLPRSIESEWHAYHAHPALVEGCFQLAGLLFDEPAAVRIRSIGEIALRGGLGSDCWCRVSRREGGSTGGSGPEELRADLELFDREGQLLGRISDLRAEARARSGIPSTASSRGLHRVEWTAVSRETSAPARSREVDRWILVSDSTGEAGALGAELEKQGAACVFCEKLEDLPALVARFESQRHGPAGDPGSGTSEAEPGWGLILLAWSSAPLEGEREAAAHRTFRIGSWAEAIRARCGGATQVWLATRGTQSVANGDGSSSGSIGSIGREIETFATCAEMSQCRLFDASARLTQAERIALASLVGQASEDRQFAARGDSLFVPRLVDVDPGHESAPAAAARRSRGRAGKKNFRARLVAPESAEGLVFEEAPEPEARQGEVVVEVRAAALSQLDVLAGLGLARGQGRSIRGVGRDFSGIVRSVSGPDAGFRAGDEVFGIHPGALARRIVVSSGFLARKPDFLDFAEAASIPFPFLVAKYALHGVARLRAGERVWIRSGAGGVGQALIRVARSVGAEVFATAGSEERRERLRRLGVRVLDPGCDDFDAIESANSGSDDFDVIVSSDSGRAMHATLARLATGGRYVDLCPRAAFERPELGVIRLGANRSVSSVDVSEMIRTEPALVAALLEEIAEEAHEGRLAALPATVFRASHAVRAIRFMTQNRHVGRVVVDLGAVDSLSIQADPGTPSDPIVGRSFLVAGRESELASSIASWLRERGASEVVESGADDASISLARHDGWIHVASEIGRRPEAILANVGADRADFRALVSIREPVQPDPALHRAWEARLIVDRLLLSDGGNAGRSLSLSVDREVAAERVIEVIEAAMLDDACGGNRGTVGQFVLMSPADRSRRLTEAPSPLLSTLQLESGIRQRSDLLRSELMTWTPTERLKRMERFVCDSLASVLGLSEEKVPTLDVRSRLDAVGLDSLMTMELFMGLGRDLGLEIAADWFDSIPSLAEIAATLVDRFEKAAGTGEEG